MAGSDDPQPELFDIRPGTASAVFLSRNIERDSSSSLELGLGLSFASKDPSASFHLYRTIRIAVTSNNNRYLQNCPFDNWCNGSG